MADELILLPTYAKGLEDPVASGMIETFATTSDIVAAMPFKRAPQGKNPFMREAKEAAVGFRKINSDPEISHGDSEEITDQCYPISGLLEYDRILHRRYGDSKRTTDMMGQMKNANRLFTDTLFDGNNLTDPTVFTGFKARLTDNGTGSVDGTNDQSRLIANSTASGGGALSMSMLDRAIDVTNEGNALVMNRTLRTALIAWSRDTSKSGFITHDKDEQGRRIMRYGDLPILIGYGPSRSNTFLPFTETGYGGGSAVTSSIYVLSFREDGVCGINTDPPYYDALGATDSGIHLRDLFEWDCGITIEDEYSATRLSSITNAAIVA